MKEVTSTAYNFIAQIPVAPGESPAPSSKLTADVEVALTLSEPAYQHSNDGQMVRVRETETIRFVASPATLRLLAKSFEQRADECEQALDAVLRGPSIKPVSKSS